MDKKAEGIKVNLTKAEAKSHCPNPTGTSNDK